MFHGSGGFLYSTSQIKCKSRDHCHQMEIGISKDAGSSSYLTDTKDMWGEPDGELVLMCTWIIRAVDAYMFWCAMCNQH